MKMGVCINSATISLVMTGKTTFLPDSKLPHCKLLQETIKETACVDIFINSQQQAGQMSWRLQTFRMSSRGIGHPPPPCRDNPVVIFSSVLFDFLLTALL